MTNRYQLAVTAFGLAVLLALTVGRALPAGAATGDVANLQRACTAIESHDRKGDLDSHAAETEIKLDAAKSGVPEELRSFIDAYYRGDRAAGLDGMRNDCEVTG